MVAIVPVVYFRSSSSGAGGTIAANKMLPNNTDWFGQALFVMMDPACFSSKG